MLFFVVMRKKIKYIIPIILILIGIILYVLININNQPKWEDKINISNEDIVIEDNKDEERNLLIQEKIDYVKSLKEINENTYGYIEIKDSVISYPVLYTKGEDYYERRDFYKKYSTGGSIFVNKNNNISPRDDNLIIYGHNMKNGTMFGSLLKYLDNNYLESHKIITFVTDVYEEYEVVSVFKSQIYPKDSEEFKFYREFNFNNEDEFNNFVNNIKKISSYKDMEELKLGDKFILLCTCYYHVENGRLGVLAKKIS